MTTRGYHEEAHFFAFVAHNTKEHGQDSSTWNRLDPRSYKKCNEPPLLFREYRSQHDGCWVCYGKGNNHAHDHRHCKVYEDDKKAYFAAHPDKKPKEQQIADWKAKGGDGGKGQGKGQGKSRGKGYGGGPGPDRRVRSIEEVAEDMLRTLEELKPSNVVDKVWADRSRRKLRQVKEVPTRTGPRCAPSACYPC